MSGHHQHRHQPHRHIRLSVAPPPPIRVPRIYPPFPATPATPSTISTPSKRRHSSSSSATSSSATSLVLALFSLRSLYSLLPFIRSSPFSFSLFPFSFLVSLLSFALSLLSLALFPSSPPTDPNFPRFLSFKSLTLPLSDPSLLRPLATKSVLLTLVFLLRFHALRYCGAGASILADLAGSLAAKSLSDDPRAFAGSRSARRGHRIRGLVALLVAVSLLSFSWDRAGCVPLSSSPPPTEGCARVAPMLLPFVAGFLAYHERAATYWVSLRQLGWRRVRLFTLALTTVILFFPALVSFLLAEGDDGAVSVMSVGWPLINIVVFGVILVDNHGDEKEGFSANFRRDFMVTYFCTLVLELFYFPNLSLPGCLCCGFLLWISVRELGSSSLNYVELGSSDYPESLYSMIMKPIRHILSERKSRKIALFLLINTAYMVVEFVAGFMSNSLGLISDACHMLFDCAALAIGLYASYISRLPANSQFNYGRGRVEVLSGYVNAVFLVLVGALIVLESFERILDPQEISTNSLLAVSIGGLVVNMVGLVFFHEEHHHAHGGGGTCTHSHSHHHHHHHQHVHEGEARSVHRQCVGVPCESSDGHSHGGHEHHGCNHDGHEYHGCNHDGHEHHNCNHDGLPHSHNDEYENDTSHCHGGEHSQNSHSHEHSHGNQAEVHFHQRLDDSSRSSQNHCSEGDAHNDFHVEKESNSSQEPQDLSQTLDHAHCDSYTQESSVKGKSSSDMQKHHHHIDHNMEGIFLHVLADTMGSVGVVISTLLIKYKGWLVADPACSIFISVMIVSSVIPLLRNSAEILLQRIPRAHERDLKAAVDDIMRIRGVRGIQNMHVWNFTNANIVGTLHLHVLAETDKASALRSASKLLHEAGIEDLTIQVECIKG